jgi:hypothetical protein
MYEWDLPDLSGNRKLEIHMDGNRDRLSRPRFDAPLVGMKDNYHSGLSIHATVAASAPSPIHEIQCLINAMTGRIVSMSGNSTSGD